MRCCRGGHQSKLLVYRLLAQGLESRLHRYDFAVMWFRPEDLAVGRLLYLNPDLPSRSDGSGKERTAYRCCDTCLSDGSWATEWHTTPSPRRGGRIRSIRRKTSTAPQPAASRTARR